VSAQAVAVVLGDRAALETCRRGTHASSGGLRRNFIAYLGMSTPEVSTGLARSCRFEDHLDHHCGRPGP
jgi:hypothetical protein